MEHNKIIDDLLLVYKPLLGKDYGKYRNHVYRVFGNCLLLDQDKNSTEKYAVAAVFHDIGIWTDDTIDYLEPSVAQARLYLTQTNKSGWVEEITFMIQWHHKVTRYSGKFERSVSVFRKADWIDVSLGLLHFGCDPKAIKDNRRQLPNLGFHLFLLKKVFRNFFRHPFAPLPMFKR